EPAPALGVLSLLLGIEGGGHLLLDLDLAVEVEAREAPSVGELLADDPDEVAPVLGGVEALRVDAIVEDADHLLPEIFGGGRGGAARLELLEDEGAVLLEELWGTLLPLPLRVPRGPDDGAWRLGERGRLRLRLRLGEVARGVANDH